MIGQETEQPRSIAMHIIAQCGTDYIKLKNSIATAIREKCIIIDDLCDKIEEKDLEIKKLKQERSDREKQL